MAAMLPPILVQRFIDVHGEAAARAWIDAFPRTLEAVRERWALTLGEPYEYIGYAYVVRAELPDGTPAVLKLAPPEADFETQLPALQHYNGDGMCRLIDGDNSIVALLLERLEPGTTLARLEDDVAATEIAANLAKRLFKPLPAEHPFATVERWGRAFHEVREKYSGGCGSFPADLFDPAFDLYFNLCASQAEPVLIHGDFHHHNILQAQREPWLAIDPKGLAGEPAYEIGPFLYNRLDADTDTRRLTLRRIEQFAEILGLDRQRLIGWGFAEAVLSSVWTFQDQGWISEEGHLRVARALLPFI